MYRLAKSKGLKVLAGDHSSTDIVRVSLGGRNLDLNAATIYDITFKARHNKYVGKPRDRPRKEDVSMVL